MSRPPRFSYPHAVHHVTLRCNNREFLFEEPSFELFLQVIQQARRKFPLSLYNYCLMTNHVHLLFQAGKGDTLSEAMHWIANSFSRRFNRATGRNGHLWEGRFRSTIIEASSCFFRCMAYVDLNPVRAGLAVAPLGYRWSAHRALRDEDASVLDFHPLYLEVGPDAPSRYRFHTAMLAEEAARPAVSLATRYFVGTAWFVRKMEKRFGLGGRGAFIERADLGSGIVSVGPRLGGPTRSKISQPL
jgi:putative transposase